MTSIYRGFAVCYVNEENGIEPSHCDGLGWTQEVYETLDAARQRERELLEIAGGVWEIVHVSLSFLRDQAVEEEGGKS